MPVEDHLTTLEHAAQERWDVVVVGSSFASMFFVHGLPRGLRILVIEKGPIVAHDVQVRDGLDAYAERFEARNHSGTPKGWVAHGMFGGNSNCWWACTPRMHPNDFRLHSRYGIGTDWPLDYAELEPHYLAAERIMEINGQRVDTVLPRSADFPHPPHAPSRSDIILRRHSPNWFAQPSARATTGTRPPCCATGVCSLCPIDAKFTIQNSFDSFARDDLRVVTGAAGYRIERSAGLATALVVRDASGREVSIAADLFALGANAIFNTEILLRSGFNSPALGRYLHEQASQIALVDVSYGNYFGGTSITGHGYDLYDGPHRAQAGAVLIENYNAPAALRVEKGRWLNRLHLKLIVEDLPQSRNRVSLTNDRATLDWFGHDDYAYRGLERARQALTGLLPAEVEAISFLDVAPTEAHIQGTHRMGTDPGNSVLRPDLITHECENLAVLGTGAFPSCSPANPTLTLCALSLYAASKV